MATITLQRTGRFQAELQRTAIGPLTGNLYLINPLGQVTVDTQDQPYFVAHGWIPAFGQFSGQPTSGNSTLDFGAFPGQPEATLVVSSPDISDPAAIIDAWIIPAATTDHTSDEHLADPPRLAAINTTPGTSFTIYGFPSGRDLPVPPGTPFGNAANSQMPVGQQQLMPSGKWNVGWAYSP